MAAEQAITLTNLALLSIIALLGSSVYNAFWLSFKFAVYFDDVGERVGQGSYILLSILSVVVVFITFICAFIYVVSNYSTHDSVMMVIAAFSLILTHYSRYYERFKKAIWTRRFLYS